MGAGTSAARKSMAAVKSTLDEAKWKTLVSFLLAVLGGYVDVVCFIRFDVFPATQTGNVVFLGRTLHHLIDPVDNDVPEHSKELVRLMDWEEFYFRCSVIVISCLGAFAYCAFEHRYPAKSATWAAPLLSAMVLMGDLIPYSCGDLGWGPVEKHSQNENHWARWSVLFVSCSLGAVHFMCGPTSDGSRLKAVTFAATGHLHKMTKILWKVTDKGLGSLKLADKTGFVQSGIIFLGMVVGSGCGAYTYHKTDVWLFAPVAAMLFLALLLHDNCISPPPNWGKVLSPDLSAPLVPPAKA